MKVAHDKFSNLIVLYVPSRQKRPEEKRGEEFNCPFCKGNERLTPNEILRLPKKREWKVRVVPNKYPILKHHEVIIHTPDHKVKFNDVPFENARLIFEAYRSRFNHYNEKYPGKVLIYCNEGEPAGASILHSHSQLIVLDNDIKPNFPKPQPVENLVEENEFSLVYCPEISVWPYELWIKSKKEQFFGEVKDEELVSLVFLVRKYIKRLKEIHEITHKFKIPFAYNWYIYPLRPWYFRIIPRFVYHAGLEIASNVVANPITPLEASLAYKGIGKDYAKVLEKLERLGKEGEGILKLPITNDQ